MERSKLLSAELKAVFADFRGKLITFRLYLGQAIDPERRGLDLRFFNLNITIALSTHNLLDSVFVVLLFH